MITIIVIILISAELDYQYSQVLTKLPSLLPVTRILYNPPQSNIKRGPQSYSYLYLHFYLYSFSFCICIFSVFVIPMVMFIKDPTAIADFPATSFSLVRPPLNVNGGRIVLCCCPDQVFLFGSSCSSGSPVWAKILFSPGRSLPPSQKAAHCRPLAKRAISWQHQPTPPSPKTCNS